MRARLLATIAVILATSLLLGGTASAGGCIPPFCS